MAHFIIDHIGPIRHAEFDLNRVNVFIGPQSVGKSTIAKIISFCLWLEKYVIRQQHIENIDVDFFNEKMVRFHKMTSYFTNESRIQFNGNAINIDYHHDVFLTINKTKEFDGAKIGKVAYVPAERNIVAMANVNSFKLEDDYIRDFVFEWLGIRSKYSKTNATHIPGTNVSYYYDEIKGDTIELSNGKPIFLTESSSGLQSATPLYIYCRYVSDWIYKYSADMSYEDVDKIIEGVGRKTYNELKTVKDSTNILKGNSYEENVDFLTNLVKSILSNGSQLPNEFKTKYIERYAESISRPHFTQLIIEEPELSLFPETQVKLLHAILKLLSNDRPDNLVVTTHSPYILYALNNCLLLNIVKNKMPKSKLDKIECSDIVLNPTDVSVYELEEGTFRSIEQNVTTGKFTIQDDSGLIRQNFFDRVMKGIMDDFNSLLDYRY